jgi:hypothetical protein
VEDGIGRPNIFRSCSMRLRVRCTFSGHEFMALLDCIAAHHEFRAPAQYALLEVTR